MIHQFKCKDIVVLEDATLSIQLKNLQSLAFITSKSGCKYVWQYGLWSSQTGYTKLERFAKIRVCKVDNFILPLYLMPKLRSVAQNEWKKHPYIFFLLLVQK